MKKFVLLTMVLAAMAVLAFGGYQTEIHKVSRGYIHVRPGGVTASDVALSPSTSSWHDVSGWRRVPEDWQTLSVSFYAYGDGSGSGNPAGGTFVADLYVVHEFGSAIQVCTVNGTIGDLELSHDPTSGPGSHYQPTQVADPNYKWAEGPLQVTSKLWRRSVGASGVEDGIGELNFDHCGATHIYVRFGTLSNVTKVWAVMTGRRR